MGALRYRGVAALAVLAILLASCGTRADRAAFYRALANGARNQGPSAETSRSDSATPGATTTGTSSGSGVTRASAGRRTSNASASSSGALTSTPSNLSTKVVGDTIRIGIHVPITGAAPLPTDFEDYMKLIQEYVAKEAPIAGRKFQWVVEDDGYDPATGQAACRKLLGQDVLLVVGHTMPAVQDGCADLFEKAGIPYLMRGTYASLLNGRRTSYFGTISDDLQGKLLADYAVSHLSAASKKSAVVYQNDQTAARTNFVSEMKSRGGSIVAQEQSVPRQADYAATVQKLQQAGAQIVLLSMPPVDAIKLSVQAKGQGYHPTFLGGATYWNYNLTLESAGMALDGAIAFSPWASIDSSAANEFRSIYERYRPGKEPQDIGLIIWGWFNVVRTAITNAGPNLSRASVANALQHLSFTSPYWNPVNFSPTNHYGSTSVAVFRADGQAKRWRQIQGFSSRF